MIIISIFIEYIYNHLLLDSHPCLIWLLVLPLDLCYTLPVPLLCFQWSCPVGTQNIPCSKSHVHFPFLSSYKKSVHFRGPVWQFITACWGVVSPSHKLQAGGQLLLNIPHSLLICLWLVPTNLSYTGPYSTRSKCHLIHRSLGHVTDIV